MLGALGMSELRPKNGTTFCKFYSPRTRRSKSFPSRSPVLECPRARSHVARCVTAVPPPVLARGCDADTRPVAPDACEQRVTVVSASVRIARLAREREARARGNNETLVGGCSHGARVAGRVSAPVFVRVREELAAMQHRVVRRVARRGGLFEQSREQRARAALRVVQRGFSQLAGARQPALRAA